MQNEIKLINCKELDVMASIEYYDQTYHDSYFPHNILFVIKRGSLNLKVGNKVHTYGKNKNVLVKRYTKGTYFKTFTEEEGYAKIYALAFHEKLIKNIIQKIRIDKNIKLDEEEIPFIQEIKTHRNIEDFYSYLESIFSQGTQIDEKVLQDQIATSLQNILEVNPEVYNIFRKISIPTKAKLLDFMEHNYKNHLNTRELARLSGRSLATFYRDFKEEFEETPHAWILSRRLEEAYSLINKSSKTSIQIYIELGFKDLAHFSKVFKKKFGFSPSQLKKK